MSCYSVKERVMGSCKYEFDITSALAERGLAERADCTPLVNGVLNRHRRPVPGGVGWGGVGWGGGARVW